MDIGMVIHAATTLANGAAAQLDPKDKAAKGISDKIVTVLDEVRPLADLKQEGELLAAKARLTEAMTGEAGKRARKRRLSGGTR